jgi:hypothetical protein
VAKQPQHVVKSGKNYSAYTVARPVILTHSCVACFEHMGFVTGQLTLRCKLPQGGKPATHGGMVTDGYCSGEFPFNVMIVDTLAIPATVPAGEYVLGFRWDCACTCLRACLRLLGLLWSVGDVADLALLHLLCRREIGTSLVRVQRCFHQMIDRAPSTAGIEHCLWYRMIFGAEITGTMCACVACHPRRLTGPKSTRKVLVDGLFL